MKAVLFSLLLLFGVVTPALAVSDPATINIMSQQLAALKEQIVTFKESLQETKFISDEVYEVRDTLDAVYEEYETLSNQSVEDWNYLLRQYESLSNLQYLKDAKSFKEKYQILHNEVSMRFKKAGIRPGGQLQQASHGTLIEMNTVDEELARIDKQLDAVRHSKRETSQSISTEAELINARSALQIRKTGLLEDQAQQDRVLGALEWDEDFADYLKGDMRKGTDSISDNVVLSFIKNVLDPNYVYKALGAATMGVNFYLLMFGLFLTFRMLQEGFSSLGGKPNIGYLFWDALRSIKGYLIYANAGLLVVLLMFACFEYFDANMGVAYAHHQVADLRTDMIQQDNKEDMALLILKTVANVGNIFSAGAMLIIYHGVSTVYVFLSRLIDVIFAVCVVYVWACGVLVVATEVLPKKFRLTDGWMMSVYTIFLWAITEFLLVGILTFVIKGAGAWLKGYYGGMGSVLISALWYGFASIVMVLITLMRILAPFAAVKLASHQGVVSAFGGAAAAVGAILGNNLATRFLGGDGQRGGGTGGAGGPGAIGADRMGLLPDPAGTRSRDDWARKFSGMAEKAGDIAHAPMGDLYRAGREKVADALHGPRGEPLVQQLRPDNVPFPDVGPTNRAEGVSDQMQKLSDSGVQQDLMAQGWGVGPEGQGTEQSNVLHDPQALADLQNIFGPTGEGEA